jgi:hypothetical protein
MIRNRFLVPLLAVLLLASIPPPRGHAAVVPHTVMYDGITFPTGTNGCTGPVVGIYGSAELRNFVRGSAADFCNSFSPAQRATAPDVEFVASDACPGVDYAADDSTDPVIGVSILFSSTCTGAQARSSSLITDHIEAVNVEEAITACSGATSPEGGVPNTPAQQPCVGFAVASGAPCSALPSLSIAPPSSLSIPLMGNLFNNQYSDLSQIGGCSGAPSIQLGMPGSGGRTVWCDAIYGQGTDQCVNTTTIGVASNATTVLTDVCGNPYTSQAPIDPVGTIGYASRATLLQDPRQTTGGTAPVSGCGYVGLGVSTGGAWNGPCDPTQVGTVAQPESGTNPEDGSTMCDGDLSVVTGQYPAWSYVHFDTHSGTPSAAVGAYLGFIQNPSYTRWQASGFINPGEMNVQRTQDGGPLIRLVGGGAGVPGAAVGGFVQSNAYPYADGSLIIQPWVLTQGGHATLGVLLQNSTATPTTLSTVDFAFKDFGMGNSFQHIGTVNSVTVPAATVVDGDIIPARVEVTFNWTPTISGHICFEVTLTYPDGYVDTIRQNIAVMGFTSVGTPLTDSFDLCNTHSGPIQVGLGSVTVNMTQPGWNLSFPGGSTINLAPNGCISQPYTITPPAGAGPGSTATILIEGFDDTDGVSLDSISKTVVIGSSLAAPTVTTPISNTIINTGVITVTGTALGGSQVTVGDTQIGTTVTTVADPGGYWSVNLPLPNGSSVITATQSLGGAISTVPISIPVTIAASSTAFLYPRLDLAHPTLGTLPASYHFGLWDAASSLQGPNARSLATSPGSAQQASTAGYLYQAGDASPSMALDGEFLSAPLAAQTIPAGAWSVGLGIQASLLNAGAPDYTGYLILNVINGSTGQVRGTLVSAPIGAEKTTEGSEVTAYQVSVQGAAVTVQAGDYLEAEIGVRTSSSSAVQNTTLYTSGTAAITVDGNSTSTADSFIQAPIALTFQ